MLLLKYWQSILLADATEYEFWKEPFGHKGEHRQRCAAQLSELEVSFGTLYKIPLPGFSSRSPGQLSGASYLERCIFGERNFKTNKLINISTYTS